MKEEWRPVAGFEGRYEVSSMGRVRGVGPRSGGLRKLHRTKSGHSQVCLYVSKGKTISTLVHPLVSEAFIGIRPAGLICCHNDGDGQNNQVDNLRYDTPGSNSLDMVKHGRSTKGEKSPNARLTDAAIREVRKMKGAATYRDIAAKFGVSFTTIQKIMSGRGWGHVQG